ncbi:MAG: hypothetical protein HYV09_28950 [Deltaproteobacteria bacterium]|nr:hypothetical protein [Deltaproteobacteria bacterium]
MSAFARRVAAAALLLAACTVEQGTRPVIDALTLADSATLDPDGTYHVAGLISYHDDDDEVRRIRVQVPSLGSSAQYPASGRAANDAAIALRIVGTAPKGPLAVTVSVIDAEANESDPRSATVTLK